MIRTRYFGQLVDPTKYKGLRGWWLNALNRIRVWIEKRVALHILVLECRAAGIPSVTIRLALKQAKKDPNFVPQFEERLVKGAPRVLLRERFPVLFEGSQKAEHRYKPGRANSEDAPYERPIPIEEGLRVTLAQFEKRNDRGLRYLSGRNYIIQTDGEGIEPVKGTGNEQREFDPNARAAARRRARAGNIGTT